MANGMQLALVDELLQPETTASDRVKTIALLLGQGGLHDLQQSFIAAQELDGLEAELEHLKKERHRLVSERDARRNKRRRNKRRRN